MAQTVKNLTTVQETRVQSLGQEDPLEKEMATHSGILAWRVPRTEEPGGLQSMVSQRVGHNSVIALSLFTFVIVSQGLFIYVWEQSCFRVLGSSTWWHQESGRPSALEKKNLRAVG